MDLELVEVAIHPAEGYLDSCMKLFKGGIGRTGQSSGNPWVFDIEKLYL